MVGTMCFLTVASCWSEQGWPSVFSLYGHRRHLTVEGLAASARSTYRRYLSKTSIVGMSWHLMSLLRPFRRWRVFSFAGLLSVLCCLLFCSKHCVAIFGSLHYPRCFGGVAPRCCGGAGAHLHDLPPGTSQREGKGRWCDALRSALACGFVLGA